MVVRCAHDRLGRVIGSWSGLALPGLFPCSPRACRPLPSRRPSLAGGSSAGLPDLPPHALRARPGDTPPARPDLARHSPAPPAARGLVGLQAQPERPGTSNADPLAHAEPLHQRRLDRRRLPQPPSSSARGRATATLYLPYELATVTVPLASLARAKAIAYRPKVVRGHMLRRIRLYRRYGHRFPRKATVRGTAPARGSEGGCRGDRRHPAVAGGARRARAADRPGRGRRSRWPTPSPPFARRLSCS